MLTLPTVSSQRVASLVTVPSLWFAAPRRSQRFMPNQGLLAITFFESISFTILLILYFLLDRDRPARFFRFWIAGWAALTVLFRPPCSVLPVCKRSGPADRPRVLSGWSGVAVLRSRLGILPAADVRPCSIWPMALHWDDRSGCRWNATRLNRLSGAHLPTGILQSALLLGAGWLLWRHSRSTVRVWREIAGRHDAAGGLHGMDVSFWPSQYFLPASHRLAGFFQCRAWESRWRFWFWKTARMRLEDLNEKLRRVTLITAASTQSLNVDQMLGVVLHHLVESLNASHGLVRLVASNGDGSGTDHSIGDRIQRRLPAWSTKIFPCNCRGSERIFEQEQVYAALDGENGVGRSCHGRCKRIYRPRCWFVFPGPMRRSAGFWSGSKGKTKISPRRNHVSD